MDLKDIQVEYKIGGVTIGTKTILIGVVVIVALGWYMLSGGPGGSDVQDLRKSADEVRTNLDSAGQHNDAAIDGLARAQQAERELQDTQQQLAETNNKLRDVQQEYERIVNNGQQRTATYKDLAAEIRRIVQEVRENGRIQDTQSKP